MFSTSSAALVVRGEQPIVIRITHHAIEDSFHPATSLPLSEKIKQSIHEETVQNCTEHRSLFDAVGEGEESRALAVPSDIGGLQKVDAEEEP